MPVDDRSFSAIELRENRYTVEQALVRNKYAAYDEDGDVVLRAKQKLFELKEEFPFVDADGNEVFTVKAGGILDVAGNYAIVDAETDERVVVLDNDFSMFRDTWTIRDGETEAALAKITSRGAVVTLARNLLPVGELIPPQIRDHGRERDPRRAHRRPTLPARYVRHRRRRRRRRPA